MMDEACLLGMVIPPDRTMQKVVGRYLEEYAIFGDPTKIHRQQSLETMWVAKHGAVGGTNTCWMHHACLAWSFHLTEPCRELLGGSWRSMQFLVNPQKYIGSSHWRPCGLPSMV